MSFTQTNAPARTSAAQISAPTPLPPPVTSARLPDRSMSIAIPRSDLHDDRDHGRTAAGALVDESRERLATMTADRFEVGRPLDGGGGDRLAHDRLRLLDEVVRLGRVHPAARHDLGPGDDVAGCDIDRHD